MRPTYKRVIRADQEGFAFPKMKRVRIRPGSAEVPEKTIQAITDTFLQLNHMPFFRLPDNMFKAILANPIISRRLKGWILHELGGWPDNITVHSLCEFNGIKFCLAALVENKTEKGRLHGKQKICDKELGFNVCRGEDDIKLIIAEFKKFLQLLQYLLSAYDKNGQVIKTPDHLDGSDIRKDVQSASL
jgi:hypothetical protein